MADLFLKYSGTPANDTGLNAQVITNTNAANGQDYSFNSIIQRRFGVTCVYGASATQGAVIYVQPKVGTNYGANVNANKAITIEFIAASTVYQEFILESANTPKDCRLNVDNNSGDSITITVEHESAVLSDTP